MLKKLGDLDQYEEIYDEDAADIPNAVGVQIIIEHVRTKGRTFLRQKKIFFDQEYPIENITKEL